MGSERITPEVARRILNEKPFFFDDILRISATTWDALYQNLIYGFVAGFAELRYDILKSVYDKVIQSKQTELARAHDLNVRKVKRLVAISARDLMMGHDITDESKLSLASAFDSAIMWFRHLTARRRFNAGDARAIKELITDMMLYGAYNKAECQLAYEVLKGGRPKKYTELRDAIAVKEREMAERGMPHDLRRTIEAIETDRGELFPFREKIIKAIGKERARKHRRKP